MPRKPPGIFKGKRSPGLFSGIPREPGTFPGIFGPTKKAPKKKKGEAEKKRRG